ncbi:MAG: hypothetical protein ACFFFH_02530 [Candidatus Thorarchaeota archaeon]
MRSGIFFVSIIGTILSTMFTPWIQDNLLIPDTSAYLATENITLEYDQFWFEPETDLSFSRGNVIGITWVASGNIDFYIFDSENLREFQKEDNRLLKKFQPIFEVKGEKTLTTEIQAAETARYYLIWHYSLQNAIENSHTNVDLSFTIQFPSSSKMIISPLMILVIFILTTYFVAILVAFVKRFALSPISKDIEEERESRRREKRIQEPQLCSNCYTIVPANETHCQKCGRHKLLEDSLS